MSIHISHAAKRDCYAITWSYGEICVGCGCCQKGKAARKPRIEYWKAMLKDAKTFKAWSKYPDLYALQKRNMKANIEYARLMIWYCGGKA
jgi:hypothetical protein